MVSATRQTVSPSASSSVCPDSGGRPLELERQVRRATRSVGRACAGSRERRPDPRALPALPWHRTGGVVSPTSPSPQPSSCESRAHPSPPAPERGRASPAALPAVAPVSSSPLSKSSLFAFSHRHSRHPDAATRARWPRHRLASHSPASSTKRPEESDDDRLRALEGVLLPAAAHAAAEDDRLVVAADERRVVAGLEQSPVLFVSRIVHRGQSQVGHAAILRGRCGHLVVSGGARALSSSGGRAGDLSRRGSGHHRRAD